MILEQNFEIVQAVCPGDEILAIGDIHGEVDLLRMLLDHAAGVPPQGRRILILTGDLIDRGPHSLATLKLAALGGERVHAVEQISLMGNHEQMLLCGVGGEQWWRAQAYQLWVANGGSAVLREVLGSGWTQNHGPGLVRKALAGSLPFLEGMRSHARSGDVVFVHAGLSPHIAHDTFLATPWDRSFNGMREEEHWAWIREPFLEAENHRGLFVCHGHSPGDGIARRGAAMTSRDRLNLDVGSTRIGIARMARFVGHRITVYDAIGTRDET